LLNRHGDQEGEKLQGQIAVTLADLAIIPGLVASPDYTVIGLKRHEETLIAYSKKIGPATYIYLEEVLDSRKNKALRSKTLYKKKGTVDADQLLNIIKRNSHTDIAGAKMVVGTGGHPGGEAEKGQG
jgi:hypothetical protein